jgi:hypothetical protein
VKCWRSAEMAGREHSFQPTAPASATIAATVASLPTSFPNIRDTFTNLTLSARDILRVPLRLVPKLDRLFSEGSWQLLGARPRGVGNGPVVEAARVAVGQPAAVVVGWRGAFAEAFQLSNTRSYWGMLHYLTSRWAFTTFSLVSTEQDFCAPGGSRCTNIPIS